MDHYILNLIYKEYDNKILKNIKFDLSIKENDELLIDFHSVGDRESKNVYNDYLYYAEVFDENEIKQHIEAMYVNDEFVDKSLLKPSEFNQLFLDCFGLVKIEVVIDGISYVTKNISVMIRQNSINKSVENMINYIYSNCEEYLYEEHKYSKRSVGIKPNHAISLDSKLALVNQIYEAYQKCYNTLRYSAQTKVINIDKIDDFTRLQFITPNTIHYISTHPDELIPVNYNSGISINKQYYQPEKTLVKSVDYSYDTYENQIIVGFIKTIITELKKIKQDIESILKRDFRCKEENGYIESYYLIYTNNKKILNEYLYSINNNIDRFQKLYFEYRKILMVDGYFIKRLPNYTYIFRNVVPYRIIFGKIINWFNCGIYDLRKSDLLLSFISLSKIYEYFCLLKILSVFKNNGYKHKGSSTHKYLEDKYYKNTTYNNTFEFVKNNYFVTVYFQPVIYGNIEDSKYKNNIHLFRNTSISISCLLDQEEYKGKYYTPDYIIKIEHDNRINYYILDAKHSKSSNIKKFQLPNLVFKYLFSVSPTSNNAELKGLFILCGKEESNSFINIYDNAEKDGISILPETAIINLSGLDIDNDLPLNQLIKNIEDNMEEL